MKKQRSASPSQAMPRSAPDERTASMISRRFSSSSGFGSWSGNSPAGVEDGCALVAQPGGVALEQAGGAEAHVAPDADAQVADGLALEVRQHAREGAAEAVGDVLVDLLAVEAADVVGLEDSWVDRHA